MSRSVKQIDVSVRTVFLVYDANDDVVTGLVNGDFTKRLTANGANSAITVTVSEVANGRYTATFTPTATGHWHLLITHATYNERGWQEDFDVTTDGAYQVDDILDKTAGVEAGYTLRQTLRLIAAATCGKVSGAPGSPVFRNMPDTTNRITAVADADGNRTTVTLAP